jgi:hypothetical protein
MVTYRQRAKEEGTKNLMASLKKEDKSVANQADGEAKSEKKEKDD